MRLMARRRLQLATRKRSEQPTSTKPMIARRAGWRLSVAGKERENSFPQRTMFKSESLKYTLLPTVSE